MLSHLCCDGAKQLTDERELVLFCVALHDGAPCPHLCHDASCSPQVNGGTVVSLAYQKSDFLIRHRLLLLECPPFTEITP